MRRAELARSTLAVSNRGGCVNVILDGAASDRPRSGVNLLALDPLTVSHTELPFAAASDYNRPFQHGNTCCALSFCCARTTAAAPGARLSEMKESLLEFLICPTCHGELVLGGADRRGNEIVTGDLLCSGCHTSYRIRGGIPRFVTETSPELRATAENFGAQWLAFDHLGEHHHEQFRDWIAPVDPEFVDGKIVLEGGCGKGRHTQLIAGWGARAVVGIDLSEAVEVAYRNTGECENAHIIQADICRLPLRPVFDYAFSVGVLHHLPNPRAGFLSLAKRLKPGGAISAWVYGRENNGWIVSFVNPVREHLTSKLPFRVLFYLSYLPTVLLYLLLKAIYSPLKGTSLGRRLFYADYLGYISRFPFHEIHNIVHDHLTAPVAHYISREEFHDWFREAQARRVEIAWHNRNSWRGFGLVGDQPEVAEVAEVADVAEVAEAEHG